MNKFLNKPGSGNNNPGNEKSNFEIVVNAKISKVKAQEYQKSIAAIVNNTTEDDVILLGKLCENAIMRDMALSYLRQNIK